MFSRITRQNCTYIIYSALLNGFIKRTLQLENITSLKMAVKVIQENNAFRKGEEQNEKCKFRKKKKIRGELHKEQEYGKKGRSERKNSKTRESVVEFK